MEPAAKKISIRPASPELNCRENTDSQSLFNRIKKCFNCLKQPKTLLAISGVLLGAGAMSTGLAFAPPTLAFAPILLPLGIALVGSGVALGSIALALKLYQNIKKERKKPKEAQEEKADTSPTPETKATAPLSALNLDLIKLMQDAKIQLQKSLNKSNDLLDIADINKNDSIVLANYESLCYKEVEYAKGLVSAFKSTLNSLQPSAQTDELVSCFNFLTMSIENVHSKITALHAARKTQEESEKQQKSDRCARLITNCQCAKTTAMDAINKAQKQLISQQEAAIICLKALTITKNAQSRLSSEANYFCIQTEYAPLLEQISALEQQINMELERLEQKGVEIKKTSRFLDSCYEADLETRFIGLPRLNKLSLNELRIDYLPLDEFEKAQNAPNNLKSEFFVGTAAAIDDELKDLTEDKLSRLFSLVKYYLPDNSNMNNILKSAFMSFILELLGYEPKIYEFEIKSRLGQANYPRYKQMDWRNSYCCALELQGQIYIMDFTNHDIITLEDYEDNQPELFHIFDKPYYFHINAKHHREIILSSLREELQDGL